MFGQRAVGPEEAVGLVLGGGEVGGVLRTVDVGGAGPAGQGRVARAIEAVEHEDVDVVAGDDRAERDDELVGGRTGLVGVAVRCHREHDVAAGVGRDLDQAGQDRLAVGERAVRRAPQRVVDRIVRLTVVGVVALDQLDVDRRAIGRAGVRPDRAVRSVEIEDVGADELVAPVGVAAGVREDTARVFDVAPVRPDRGRSDRVVDDAVQEDVPSVLARWRVRRPGG